MDWRLEDRAVVMGVWLADAAGAATTGGGGGGGGGGASVTLSPSS